MAVIRLYATIIKIAVSLALLGQLKFCTLQLLGLASEKSARGIISFSKYNRALTR